MTNIAQNIISKFSSVQEIANICKVDVSTVHKWKYPKHRGGTAGLIPAQYQQLLLDGAPACGVELKPDDFFYTDFHKGERNEPPITDKKDTLQANN